VIFPVGHLLARHFLGCLMMLARRALRARMLMRLLA